MDHPVYTHWMHFNNFNFLLRINGRDFQNIPPKEIQIESVPIFLKVIKLILIRALWWIGKLDLKQLDVSVNFFIIRLLLFVANQIPL